MPKLCCCAPCLFSTFATQKLLPVVVVGHLSDTTLTYVLYAATRHDACASNLNIWDNLQIFKLRDTQTLSLRNYGFAARISGHLRTVSIAVSKFKSEMSRQCSTWQNLRDVSTTLDMTETTRCLDNARHDRNYEMSRQRSTWQKQQKVMERKTLKSNAWFLHSTNVSVEMTETSDWDDKRKQLSEGTCSSVRPKLCYMANK